MHNLGSLQSKSYWAVISSSLRVWKFTLEQYYRLFWNEQYPRNKNCPSFQVCTGVAIVSLTQVWHTHISQERLWCFGVFFFFSFFFFGWFVLYFAFLLLLFFFLPKQLSVLKELMMKYWTGSVNIYLEQNNILARSFTLKKKSLSIREKKTVLVNIFKAVLI